MICRLCRTALRETVHVASFDECMHPSQSIGGLRMTNVCILLKNNESCPRSGIVSAYCQRNVTVDFIFPAGILLSDEKDKSNSPTVDWLSVCLSRSVDVVCACIKTYKSFLSKLSGYVLHKSATKSLKYKYLMHTEMMQQLILT